MGLAFLKHYFALKDDKMSWRNVVVHSFFLLNASFAKRILMLLFMMCLQLLFNYFCGFEMMQITSLRSIFCLIAMR